MTGSPLKIAALDEIPALTSLRGIGAVAVCFFHAEVTLIWTLGDQYLPIVVHQWLDFFFMLSGFVMMLAYGRVMAGGGLAPLRSFFAARVARIFPLHIVVLSAFVLIEFGYLAAQNTGLFTLDRPLFAGYTDPQALPAHYLLVQSWGLFPGWGWARDLAWNVPTWSIGAELAAYLVFPLLLWFGLADGRLRALRHALLFVGALAGISLIAWHYGTLDRMGRAGVARCLTQFTLGCLIYLYAPMIRQRLGVRLRHALEVPLALMVIWLMFPGAPQMAIAPTFMLVILLVSAPDSLIARALDQGPLRWLGEISYSIYLNHMLVIGLVHHLLWIWRPPFLQWAITPTLLILGIIVAVVLLSQQTYRRIEVPARRALRRRLGVA